LTKVRFEAAELSTWCDSATLVYANEKPVLTLYLRLLNYITQRHYVGLVFHETVSPSTFRFLRAEFLRRATGFPLEAQIDKEDKAAQRFCEFFGFKRIPQVETSEYFFYERIT